MTTVILTLLVRDEADIVAATIEHHLAQGVSHIVATDNGSVDGTIEILEGYAAAGVLSLIHEKRQDYDQSAWVTRMARLAATAHHADWVVNGDADEFWVPLDRGHTLVDALGRIPAQIDVVTAHRQDLRGRRGVNGPWADTLVWRDARTQWPDGRPLGPKAAHRGLPDVVVAQGNHGITSDRALQTLQGEPISILHLPLRSWPQFRRKIENGGSSYAANSALDASVGWHWRDDYERLGAGQLSAAYESRRLSAVDVVRYELDGRLQHDVWLKESLTALLSTSVRSDLLSACLSGR
jgi:glycosyltransferase involved in cell wall biosynthesis